MVTPPTITHAEEITLNKERNHNIATTQANTHTPEAHHSNITSSQYNDANDTSMATSSNNFDHSDNLGDCIKIHETSNDCEVDMVT